MEDIKTLIYCCVALHNMTQEVRRDNFKFNDEIEWENMNEMETGVLESIFLDNENQVGDDTAEALYARIAHMCGLLEDSTKHVQLRADLMQHIWDNH